MARRLRLLHWLRREHWMFALHSLARLRDFGWATLACILRRDSRARQFEEKAGSLVGLLSTVWPPRPRTIAKAGPSLLAASFPARVCPLTSTRVFAGWRLPHMP